MSRVIDDKEGAGGGTTEGGEVFAGQPTLPHWISIATRDAWVWMVDPAKATSVGDRLLLAVRRDPMVGLPQPGVQIGGRRPAQSAQLTRI